MKDHENLAAYREVMSTETDGELVGGFPFQEGSDEDDLEPSEEPDGMKIPASVKQAVMRLHVNTGHRSPARLARALVVCGAPAKAVAAARRLRCDVCRERQAPRARRPASLPNPREVGEQVHIDLVILEDSLRQGHVVVHVTDSVSRLQMAAVMDDKSSASVISFLKRHWIPLLGTPRVMVADQGKELASAEFSEFAESRSDLLWHCAVQAPFQNGVCERSGGVLKALVGSIVAHAVMGRDAMRDAVGEAAAAYNLDVNEEGTSPQQAVTGRRAVPLSDTLSKPRLAEHSLIENKPSLAKQVAMREMARVSMVRLHYSRALRRAELARARTVFFGGSRSMAPSGKPMLPLQHRR